MAQPTVGAEWRVAAASVQGVSHERSGTPCQDAHRYALCAGGVLVAAVADGAGSASLAEIGAASASRAAVETLCASIVESADSAVDAKAWDALLLSALRAAREAVEAAAAAREAAPRELATTLILAAALPGLVAVAQVGDGSAVIGDEEGNILALTNPQSGEFVNETVFLTMPGALDGARIAVWCGRIAHMALFTDGLQRLALKLPEAEAHAPFFTPLFRFASEMEDEEIGRSQIAAFLRSPRIVERADDDLTLLLAHLKRPAAGAG